MAAKLTTQAIQAWLKTRPGWSRKSNAVVKEYRFASFRDSIVFVNRIAGLADGVNHHPDIEILFDRVRVTLSTHSVGGITEKDLKLAEQLDFATSAA